MEIEFDTAKDAANIGKHGVSLAFGVEPFSDANHIVLMTVRAEDGEERRKVVGLVDGKLWTAIHTVRGATTRFISVRRSNDGEARIYNRP